VQLAQRPLACHKFHQVKKGRIKVSGGPEYETLAAGHGCCITNTEAVLKGNELCNDLGWILSQRVE
jgi:aldehyde:ferredoxin oxidoreductase